MIINWNVTSRSDKTKFLSHFVQELLSLKRALAIKECRGPIKCLKTFKLDSSELSESRRKKHVM